MQIQIFFDVVWLVCSLVRLVAAVLALRWIDNYRWSSGAIRLTWSVEAHICLLDVEC